MADFKYIPPDAYKLEAILRSAIEEDEKYVRENAAKFRAVEQGKNYEEFRDIVKAAHLNPLEKQDSFRPGKMGSAIWNSAAKRGNKVPKYNILSPAITDMPEMPLEDIVVDDLTHRNFERYWIYSENPEMRMELLQHLISTEDVFKGRELSPDLIGSILKTILELLEPNSSLLKCDESIDFIFKVMKVISSTSRFSLNLQFLNDDGKNILKTLMKKVTELLEKKVNHMNSNDKVLQQILDKFIC